MPRRRLRPVEVREAQEVFGNEIPYGQVWLHEHARWPDLLARLGGFLSRTKVSPGGNSVTLGRSIYFPYPLRTESAQLETGLYGDMAWLIHELTHVWQFGHGGYRYVLQALAGQLHHGPAVYVYGGEHGLAKAGDTHTSLSDFNPEQQGDIARDYYLRRKVGASTAAWDPFIAELRAG